MSVRSALLCTKRPATGAGARLFVHRVPKFSTSTRPAHSGLSEASAATRMWNLLGKGEKKAQLEGKVPSPDVVSG